jgi:hypothetical protein
LNELRALFLNAYELHIVIFFLTPFLWGTLWAAFWGSANYLFSLLIILIAIVSIIRTVDWFQTPDRLPTVQATRGFQGFHATYKFLGALMFIGTIPIIVQASLYARDASLPYDQNDPNQRNERYQDTVHAALGFIAMIFSLIIASLTVALGDRFREISRCVQEQYEPTTAANTIYDVEAQKGGVNRHTASYTTTTDISGKRDELRAWVSRNGLSDDVAERMIGAGFSTMESLEILRTLTFTELKHTLGMNDGAMLVKLKIALATNVSGPGNPERSKAEVTREIEREVPQKSPEPSPPTKQKTDTTINPSPLQQQQTYQELTTPLISRFSPIQGTPTVPMSSTTNPQGMTTTTTSTYPTSHTTTTSSTTNPASLFGTSSSTTNPTTTGFGSTTNPTTSGFGSTTTGTGSTQRPGEENSQNLSRT